MDIDKIKMPFGKYKDKFIIEIFNNDRKYVEWLESRQIDNFIKEAINQIRYNEAEEVISYIKTLIGRGEITYSQDIHAVGIDYFIADVRLEEVIGGQFYLYMRGKSGVRLDKKNFKRIQEVLINHNKECGSPSKNRGGVY